MGEVVYGVDFRKRPVAVTSLDVEQLKRNSNYDISYEVSFSMQLAETRRELASLVPFAKAGGPIEDHNDYACSESNPDGAA